MVEVWIYSEGRKRFADRLDMECKRQRGVQALGQDRVAIYYERGRLQEGQVWAGWIEGLEGQEFGFEYIKFEEPARNQVRC